ncbi:DEKNAAC100242, partial [Brettanomyces naardenensis]
MGTGITLTKSVFLPIFELLNHNFKLDLRHEKNLLFYLSLSLSTLANHVNDRQGLSEIYLLLGDLGCRFSFDTLLDYIQFILSATLNSLHCKNLKTSIFLPESLKNCFGFELFPPVRRENFSYESPISDRKGAMLGVFQETSVFQEQHFDYLLKQCILSNASLRMKTYRLLNHINQGTGIVTTCMQNTTEDGQIYKYARDQVYELANFKNGSSINYRIAFSAIEVSVKADISMLILSENLKVDDGRFSTTLSQFIMDTLLSLITIYREFGLLSIFKTVLDICKEDLRLATGAAIVFSGILPQEKEGVSDSERKEQVATIIQQNTIVCNLIRLFVEQLDDGTTLAFKRMTNFMKNHPSSLKPKKRQKGTVTLDINE